MKVIQGLTLAVCCTLSAYQLKAEPGDVVATKGDQVVTAEDLNRYVRDRVPEGRRQAFLQKPDAVAQMTENLLVIRVLAEEAREAGVVDQEQIDWQVALHRERLMMEAYLRSLEKAQTADINWEATARDVYTAEKESFQKPERVRAAHILIKTDERSEAAALSLANEVLAQLKDGKDFKLLAAKYSEDASAATNLGSLGAFGRGKMVPEFEEAAFALREPGELAGPVKSRFGYHIIKLEEYMPAREASFDEVKAEIIAGLKQEIPNSVRQNKVMEVRSSDDIKVNEELLQSVTDQLRQGDID